METFPRLKERLTNLGAQLSGGEQQMLSIGRALMTHPALIVLDEATEGLAPLIVAEIWQRSPFDLGGLKATLSRTDHMGLDFLDIGVVTFGGRLRY